MSLMGIDIGSGGCKAVIFDYYGNILSQSYCEYPVISPRPHWLEQDVNEIWSKLKEVIAESASGSKADKVKAISVSAMGDTVVPIDKDGKPLYNLLIGPDTRAYKQCETLKSLEQALPVYSITGHLISAISPLAKIIWFKEELPEIYEKTYKFLSWQGLFLSRLGLEPLEDRSMASRTVLYDINNFRWSDEILHLVEIEKDVLPEVIPSGNPVGKINKKVASELGLDNNLVVVTGGFDQSCAALGAGVIKPGLGVNVIGTVDCMTISLSAELDQNNMMKNNYYQICHTIEGQRVTIAYNPAGGALLRWYRDTFASEEKTRASNTGEDVYDLIIDSADNDVSGLYVVPHFVGTGTPYLDPQAKGIILGLDFDTDKPRIVKGIMEGMVYELMVNLEYSRGAGVDITELRASGGGAKSKKMLQLRSDMLGIPVVAMSTLEVGCLGTAMLAGYALGIYKTLNEAVDQCVRIKERFSPRLDLTEKYKNHFLRYKKIYFAVKPLFS